MDGPDGGTEVLPATQTVLVTGSTAIPVAFIPFGTAIVVCWPVAVETRWTTFVAATQIAPGASVASIGCPLRPTDGAVVCPVSGFHGTRVEPMAPRNQSVPRVAVEAGDE